MFPFQDNRIIQTNGPHQVHAQRCEVMFKDGSAIGLHPVSVDGDLQMFLRAVQTEGLQWAVFDVRHFGPDIEADVKRLPPRDAHGVVFYTLRLQYRSAAAMLDQVRHSALVTWWARTAPAATPTLAMA